MHALESPVKETKNETRTLTQNSSLHTEPVTMSTGITSTSQSPHSDTHSPTSDSEEITSLKDLNVEDTTQLSSVLHGRKAATYLRIFREDDGPEVPKESATSRDNLASSVLPTSPLISPRSSPVGEGHRSLYERKLSHSKAKEIRGDLSTGLRTVRKNNGTNGDRCGTVRSTAVHEGLPAISSLLLQRPLDLDSIRRPNILPRQRCNLSRRSSSERKISYSTYGDAVQSERSPQRRSRLISSPSSSSIAECPFPLKTKSEETSEDLSLKPVSSATYYPHRSKSKLPDQSKENELIEQNGTETKTGTEIESRSVSINDDKCIGKIMKDRNPEEDYISLASTDQADEAIQRILRKPSLGDDTNSRTGSLCKMPQSRYSDGSMVEKKTGKAKLQLNEKQTGTVDDTILQRSVITKRREDSSSRQAVGEGQDNIQKKSTDILDDTEGTISQDTQSNRDLKKSDETTTFEEKDQTEEEKEYPLAVELKPFTNKVGGHTAIFRFSKRAVCKTLVNRENRWYETMEITNSKLLKFMPKYIGVLNVRQHFRSRKDFLDQVPCKTSENSEDKSPRSTVPLQDNDSMGIKTTKNSIEQPAPLTHTMSHPNLNTPPLMFDAPEDVIQDDDLATTRLKSGYIYPEVTVDDNKHIMSNALLGRYSLRSLSDDTTREDAFLSPKSKHRSTGPGLGSGDKPDGARGLYKKNNFANRRSSGSTLLNTKLKDLILEEVFAPVCPGKQHSHSSTCVIVPKNRSSSSSSAHASAIRSLLLSNASEEKENNEKPSSSRHGLESHRSEIDLKRFHMQEVMRFQVENSPSGDLGQAQSLQKSPVIATTETESNQQSSVPPESISFEEHTRTIVSKFILLEDLTQHMKKPCALDLKMGTRQYGVDASTTKQRSQRTKCKKTTSMALGVRICGLKTWNKSYYITRDKYFGRRVKVGWQFARTLARFLYDGVSVRSIVKKIPKLIKQLELLAAEISLLKGFRLYGASLLLMYDGENDPDDKRVTKVKVHLIDFAKCVTRDDLEEGLHANGFKIPPKHPDLEDVGFLRGLKSLKFYLMFIWNYLTVDSPMLTSEEELREFLSSRDDVLSKGWDWLDEFDKEDEAEFNNPSSPLRKKWRKYELIFDVEPRFNNEDEVSD